MGIASIEVVRAAALWERVVASMRRAIILGELDHGVHLKEPHLAQRFGVSRLPVREAIAQLEREGLVRIEPRRGAFVVGVTDQDIGDIYECRLLLEADAVRRTAARIDVQGVASLRAHADQIQVTLDTGRFEEMAAADMAFHREIIVLCGSRALLHAWEPLAPRIETILAISNAAYSDVARVAEGHRLIVQALEQHQAGQAEHLVREHLANGERLVHEVVASLQRDDKKRAAPTRHAGA